MKSSLIYIFFSVLFISNLLAQPIIIDDFQLKFEHISTKQGLSNNKILDIYQDRYGYMWFATLDGLNRYDGYEVVVFRNEPDKITSLSGNLVTCITEDIYGNLWIGTHHGLNLYDRKANAFIHYLNNVKNSNSLKNNYVRALHCDSKGILWIETVDGTLNKFDIKKETFTHYKHNAVNQAYYYTHDIFEDKEANIWLGGRGISPHKFDKTKEKFTSFMSEKGNPTKKSMNEVACFFEDSNNNFWVSATDGAYTFDKKGNFKKFLSISTYSIIEDCAGFLWFGTGKGVYKYDVENNVLTHFNHDSNNPNSIIGPHINKIYQDKSGTLWFGTNDGVSKHSPVKSKFSHYYHVAGNKNTLSSNKITSVVEDENGIIWIGTDGGGLNKFNRKTGKFKNYKHEKGNPLSISSNRISNLYLDSKGNLWIGLWSGVGFNKFDRNKEIFTKYALDENTTLSDWYNDFLEDSNGNFWIGLWGGNGLYLFDREKGEFAKDEYLPEVIPQNVMVNDLCITNDSSVWIANNKGIICSFDINLLNFNYYLKATEDINSDYEFKLKLQENNTKIRNIGNFNNINAIICDQEKNMWFATDNGLYKYNKNIDDFVCFNFKEKYNFNNKITSLHNNQNPKLIWVGTEKGLVLFNIKTEKIQKFTYNKANQNSISGNFIKATYEDKEENLWIATDKGLDKMNVKTGKIFNYNKKKLNFSVINDIVEDYKGNIWIGTNSGLIIFNKASREFRNISFPNNNQINTIYEDKNRKIWAGTNKGLFLLDFVNGKYYLKNTIKTKTYPTDISELKVLSIVGDTYGNYLYLGTSKGFYLYNKRLKNIWHIRPLEPNFCKLAIHLVSDLFEDKEGDIWIGTTNTGLSKLNLKNNKLEQYFHYPYDSSSFLGSGVSCIFQDTKDNLWVCGDGLNKFNSKTNSFCHITQKDGLPSNDVMSILEDSQGKLWISSKKGLTRFDPDNKTFKSWYEFDGLQGNEFSEAHTMLKSGEMIFGGNNGFNIFHPDSIFINEYIPSVVISKLKVFEKERYNDLTEINEITLNYDENTLTFQFAALDFTNSQNNRYKYILEGFDKDWIESDAENRNIKYTNIPHGKYKFKVKASNNDGVWNEQETILRIIIKPPFWKTIWFYIIEILFALVVIFFISKYRYRKIRAKQKNIELEQKLLRSQMNPHFIFNSLGAIQSFIFDNNPIEAGTYLSDFSELIRLILENSRTEFVSLEKEIKTLEHYLKLQKLRFNNKFEYKIEVDPEIDVETMTIPPMLAQPFIENSIEHGFKNMKTKGHIKIRFALKNKTIVFESEDNGIGIKKSLEQKHADKVKKHKSLATKITKERIININKASNQKIKFEIVDLKNIKQNITGTKVIFEIPFRWISEGSD